jgi:hypothetical protein
MSEKTVQVRVSSEEAQVLIDRLQNELKEYHPLLVLEAFALLAALSLAAHPDPEFREAVLDEFVSLIEDNLEMLTGDSHSQDQEIHEQIERITQAVRRARNAKRRDVH